MSKRVYILKSVSNGNIVYSPSDHPIYIGDIDAERWIAFGYAVAADEPEPTPEPIIEKKPKKAKEPHASIDS